jgi:hypothetical protein
MTGALMVISDFQSVTDLRDHATGGRDEFWRRAKLLWSDLRKDFVMSNDKKPSQRELAEALNLSESEIALYVSDTDQMPDGSGHWIHFRTTTPKKLLSRLEVGSDLRLQTHSVNNLREMRIRYPVIE